MLRLRLGIGCCSRRWRWSRRPARRRNPSLYQGPAPRPGPDILYRPARPGAAALKTAASGTRKPILVSGSSAYRDGEFLYQDFLYDDHGAKGTSRDPGDPRTAGDSFSAPNGTYTYPTAPAYANNAADLVELRVKPLANATAFRITLNTMKNPSLVATTIAIGDLAAAPRFPHGANATAPASKFLTVHGHTPTCCAPPTGIRSARRPRCRSASAAARSRCSSPIRLEPRNAHGSPRRRSRAVGRCDRPLSDSRQTRADAHHPGGAAGLAAPTAFFNAAFRFHEPWQHTFPPDSRVHRPGLVAGPRAGQRARRAAT